MRLLTLLALCLTMSLHAMSQIRQMVIMSYNVENLMDTLDNPATADEDFTPTGRNAWTSHRYAEKLERIAEVISRAGGTQWPALVGLVEVENASTLDDLLERTPLGAKGYRYIITEGNDPRGIDVALLYRPEVIDLVQWEAKEIPFTEADKRSRPLLLAQMRLSTGQELNVGVAHFPSRRGGADETESYRRESARALRSACDSLFAEGKRHFVLMGDFNGEPEEVATRVDLGASLDWPRDGKGSKSDALQLYSLLHPRRVSPGAQYGTYLFRGTWSQLDHLIISGSLLEKGSSLRYVNDSAEVYAPDYLSRETGSAGQRAPWRTYRGPHYDGGYSDHYPVLLRLAITD